MSLRPPPLPASRRIRCAGSGAGAGNDRVLGDGGDIMIGGDDNIVGGEGNEVFLLGDGSRIARGG